MPDDRQRPPVPLGMGIAAAALGAIAWVLSRSRQDGIDARTRARLAPPAPVRRVPTAADIHVG